MKGKKRIYTEEELKWFDANFSTTKNKELAAHLDVSEKAVSRLAKIRGLKKTFQYKFRKIHCATDFCILNKGKFRFKKGMHLEDIIGKERNEARIAKTTVRRAKTLRKERARILFGLPQKTRLRVICQSEAKIQLRYKLKKRGYLLDEENRVAYYTETTNRSKHFEKKDQPWYVFRPITETESAVCMKN